MAIIFRDKSSELPTSIGIMVDSDSDTEEDIARLRRTLAEERRLALAGEPSASDRHRLAALTNALAINGALQDKIEELAERLHAMRQRREARLEWIRANLPGGGGGGGGAIPEKESGEIPARGCRAFGMPYFKDEKMFPCPKNPDARRISVGRMINYYSSVRPKKWTRANKRRLENIVFEQLKNAEAKRLEAESGDVSAAKVRSAKGESLARLSTGGGGDRIDWGAVEKAEGRHSAIECEALWRLFAAPSVNRGPWTEPELETLYRGLATGVCGDEWDDLAASLATGRTGFQCFVYSRRLAGDPEVCRGNWTEEEDEYLRMLVDAFGVGERVPWGEVALFLERRTKVQAYNRWREALSGGRKGRFLPEEDAVILAAVDEFGENYAKIAALLPGRVARQTQRRRRALGRPPPDGRPGLKRALEDLKARLSADGGKERVRKASTPSASAFLSANPLDLSAARMDSDLINYFRDLHVGRTRFDSESSTADVSGSRTVLALLGADSGAALATAGRPEVPPSESTSSPATAKIRTYSGKRKAAIATAPRSTVANSKSISKFSHLIPPSFPILIALKQMASRFHYGHEAVDGAFDRPEFRLWRERFFALFHWCVLLSEVSPTRFLAALRESSEESSSLDEDDEISTERKRKDVPRNCSDRLSKKLKIRALSN